MSKPFDPSKPCKMRGFPDKVRIICSDANLRKLSIIALATDPVSDKELPIYRKSDGTYPNDPQRDLVNIPERTEKFVNIYPNVGGAIRNTLAESNDFRVEDAVGRIKLIYEDDALVGCELMEKSDA